MSADDARTNLFGTAPGQGPAAASDNGQVGDDRAGGLGGLFDDEAAPPAAADVPAPVGPTSSALPVVGRREQPADAPATAAAAPDARTVDTATLYHYVDQLLEMLSRDTWAQEALQQLVITRDHQLDADQRREVGRVMRDHAASLGVADPVLLDALVARVYDEVVGLGPLGALWRDDDVTEIMVNAWDRVGIERNGELLLTDVTFRDAQHAREVAKRLAQTVSDRDLSASSPLVTARLPGARVQFAYGAVVADAVSISMRKFRPLLDIDKLLEFGALTDEMVEFLRDCVLARANVLVSGGTGSGKTTVINALSRFIPRDQRVVSIEDSFELQLEGDHTVRLTTKESASADDENHTSMRDLLVASLRMRPDRIIVGEVREGEVATVMLDAANTGHDGTMSTVHANNPERALNGRMAAMIRTGAGVPIDVARAEVAAALNVVVQATRSHGRRFISSIAVVDPDLDERDRIGITPIFTGTVKRGQAVQFRRVGALQADGELAAKMFNEGLDPDRWLAR